MAPSRSPPHRVTSVAAQPAPRIGEVAGTGGPPACRADRRPRAALSLREDLLAIELLAHDLLATAPARPVLGVGTAAVLRTVEEAISAANPRPDAVHGALRDRFPATASVQIAQGEQSLLLSRAPNCALGGARRR